ncbi:Anti-sigma-K factor rskA [Micromonospora nigra]|uniref:Anti-sigma-K factor rskA n=1 Tax=Micromonospora nigra TaxID=145857 RepID=A0A1C6SJE8_9ACTN|nr:anti-sigma factor [Micromonospora nigra]SCL29492.1 Anti-sigma-K factor rskA [Micromonospora nigra]
MQHLDHDRLVFLALGESEADNGESTHLAGCEPCRVEMETLQHVAGLGSATQALRDLPDPPEQVWQGIVTEIRAAENLPSLHEARRSQPVVPPARTGDAEGSGGPDRPDAAVLFPPPHRRSRWSRWAAGAVTAVAAATIGVVGTAVVLGRAGPEPAPPQVVVAEAPLAAFGTTPAQAHGDARVLADGQLHLHVVNLPAVPGYYEVWLINPRSMEMFSVGVLGDGSDVLLPLPPNVDLDAYSVVDISAEEYDNDTAHSGDSLLRGSLTG